jgi:hypothetical protein
MTASLSAIDTPNVASTWSRCQVDDVHHAEGERHADRHQEQHQPELQAVEALLE